MNASRLSMESLGLMLLGATALLLAGDALQRLLKNSRDRRTVSAVALVAAALLPIVAWLPYRPTLILRVLPVAETPSVTEIRDDRPAPIPAQAILPAGAERDPAPPAEIAPQRLAPSPTVARRFDATFAIAAVYGMGLVVVSGRLLLGYLAARRLVHQSIAPNAEVEAVWRALAGKDAERVSVRVHPGVMAPRLAGIARPCILVPRRLTARSEVAGLRFALAHELAHYRHGDLWRWALVNLSCAALWFHPLAWRLRHTVRECQEVLADAAACGEQRVEYAAFLVQAARWLTAEPQAAGLAMARRGASLEPRVRALLNENLARPLPRPLRVTALALIACGLLAFASVRLEAQAVAEPQPPAEPMSATEPAATPTAAHGQFELVVLDAETGKPLSNASAGWPRKHKGVVLWPGIDESTRRHADAQGRIPFEDRPQVESIILIEAPGYTPESHGFLPMQRENSVRIPMYHAVEVTGTVVGTEGPVAGAKVVAVGGEKYGPEFHVEKTTTDASGRFKVALPRGLPGMLTIRAGLHRFERRFDSPPTDLGEFSLEDGVWVTGRVLTSAGEPAAAFVGGRSTGEVPPYPWSDWVDCGPRSIDSVTTDAQGNYRLGPLPPGEYFVSASFLDRRQGFSRDRAIEVRDEPISHDFRLSAATRISIQVRRPGGDPVRGVTCIVAPEEGLTHQMTRSAGKFTALLLASCPSVWLRLNFDKTDLKPGDIIQLELRRDDKVVEQSNHVLAGRTLDLQFDLPRPRGQRP